MSSNRIARRYAQALFDLCRQTGTQEQVREGVEYLREACGSTRELTLMLRSPVVPPLRKGQILEKLLAPRVHRQVVGFCTLVCRKGRAWILPHLGYEFMSIYHRHMNLQPTTLTLAVPMEEEQSRPFHRIVERISGRRALLSVEVDAGIIGGFILRMGDWLVDASLRGRLGSIRKQYQ